MCVAISQTRSPSNSTDFEIQILAAPLFFPEAYNYWAHLGLEITTNIFWLTTFALLAEEAAGWSIVGDFGLDTFLPKNWNAAIGATKAGAALGAINWALFIATLISFGAWAPTPLTLTLCPQKLMVHFLGRHLPPPTSPGTRRCRLRGKPRTSRRREEQHSRHHPSRRTEPCPAKAPSRAEPSGSYCLGNRVTRIKCTARRSSRRISISRSLVWRLWL